MDEQKKLLNRIQMCDFALVDMGLYLDTHPDDEQALRFYQKYQEMRKTAATEYITKYGPLVATDYAGQTRWPWIDDPWPWEFKEA